MFSLNVPLPPAVEQLADELHPKLAGFDRLRNRHTLVCKRFGVGDVTGGGRAGGAPGGRGGTPEKPVALATLREELRPLLAGTDPFDVRVTGIDAFEAPEQGPGPVVYLAVESGTLKRVHRRLCGTFDPVEGIEGDDYVPHVTLARGGDPEAVERLLETKIEPVEWRVHALDVYDPDFRETAATIEL
ncbi:2'-5' RNA ligase family protein [Halorubrum gandharaense]